MSRYRSDKRSSPEEHGCHEDLRPSLIEAIAYAIEQDTEETWLACLYQVERAEKVLECFDVDLDNAVWGTCYGDTGYHRISSSLCTNCLEFI